MSDHIASIEALEALYGAPAPASLLKEAAHVTPHYRAFIAASPFVALATSGPEGLDCSPRGDAPGFVRVLDDRTLAYPEYRGNGVMASLGNLAENGHVGLLFIDFTRDVIGLHVNGAARVVERDELLVTYPDLAPAVLERNGAARPKAERWVLVHVEEAYIHCAKHIPRMVKVEREIAWGTDDVKRKGGDFFGASGEPRP